MNRIVSLLPVALAAASLGAQQVPPVRPARPAPAPRARVAPDAPLLPDLDLRFNRSFDLDPDLALDLRMQARDMANQAREQAALAMQNVDVQRAMDDAQRALADVDLSDVQDRAQLALARVDLSGLANLSIGESFARAPLAPWAQGDPADSLYRLAREAFNTGDWRRAADLFGSVVQKFPRSAYVADCAYYEAFSRYRIGTTDELHKALALLADPPSSGARRGTRADVDALSARIRGALAARGDQQAAAQIAQDAQKAGGCDREDMSVKAEALNALGQMDPAAATPLLRRVLARRDPCSIQLRRSALFMLVRRGDTVATDALIGVATSNDEDPELRTDAIMFLGRMPGSAPLVTLQNLLKSSDDDRIQRAAVRALAMNGSPEARKSVRALVERSDVSESLRAEAIDAVASRDATADDAAYLRTAYASMPSERLKQAVLRALARVGGPDNDQFILGVARNTSESSEVRGAAIQYAGQLSSVSIAELSKLYDASDSRNLRDQIIIVLARRDEPDAADKLMDIAKTGTDPETRREAISVLSRKKDDPRVTKFLLDLVSR
ncbi:MAG: HEAT repeat domain-containing protein [Gemmatimonadota bacterium]|nr:HEAT repeat domain-containing protein [Gemmatimonadota bacterium]